MSFAYVICGGPIFETNDDVGMLMISSGNGIVDRPDEHLVYVNFLIGKVLNTLYGITQRVPWYGLLFALFQFLALTVIARVLMAKGRLGVVIAIIVLCLAALRPVVLMQFTSTAQLVAIAGALLLLVAVEKKKFLSWRILLPSLSLVMLAALIRSDGAKLILILTGLVSVARFWRTSERAKLIRVMVSLVMALSLVLLLDALTYAYYAKDRWNEFHHLNAYRAPMMVKHFDTSDIRVKEAVKSVGWSPFDLHLFESWYILDRQTYSIDKVKSLLERTPRVNELTWPTLKSVWEKIFGDLTILPMLITICILPFCVSRKRFTPVASIGLILSVAMLMSGIAVLMHLPPRVSVGMLTFLVVVFTYYASPRFLNQAHPAITFLLIVVAIFAITPSAVTLSNRCKEVKFKSIHLQEVIRDLKPDSKKLFVFWAGVFPIGLIRPFDNVHDFLKDLKMTGIGSNGRSPHVVDRLKQFGISDLIMQLDKPGVFVCCTEQVENVIEMWLKEHRKKHVHFETVYQDEMFPNLRISRVTSRMPEDEVPPLIPRQTDIVVPISVWATRNANLLGTDAGIATFECKDLNEPKFKITGLSIDPRKHPGFAIEIQVDPWQVFMGKLNVSLGDQGNAKLASYSKKLINDGKRHTYRFDLSNVRTKIERVSVDLSLVGRSSKTTISIGQIAFVSSVNHTGDSNPRQSQ